MRRPTLELTAYHEAGHAVAATFKAVRFKYVTIETDSAHGSAGHMQRFVRQPKKLEHFYADGVVTMAGEAAQRRFRPRSVRRHHSQGDRETVVDLALRVSGDQQQAELLAELWGLQAKSLIDLRWPQVERVALALLERKRLTSAEVLQLTTERLPGVTFTNGDEPGVRN